MAFLYDRNQYDVLRNKPMKPNMLSKYLQFLVNTFAIGLIALAFIAFVSKSSIVSLVVGLLFGSLILGFANLWKRNSPIGFWGLASILFLLGLSFIERAISTGKGLPIFLGTFNFIIFALIIISKYQKK